MPWITELRRGTTLTLMLALALPAVPGRALTPSPLPLESAASVSPNVMILLDNSGSMDNLAWASGFSASITYPDWGNGSWRASDGNLLLKDLPTCGDGGIPGEQGGVRKCLYLPDPVGGGRTRVTGNYLNYLFSQYADGTDLRSGPIPTLTRLTAARSAVSDLLNMSNLRFGLATFGGSASDHYARGADVLAECGSSPDSIRQSLSTVTASRNTPLAEALYEITRYFRGQTSYYRPSLSYTSPVTYRCQPSAVVVLTDGLPTYDRELPSSDPDSPQGFPDWDGLHPDTTASQYPNFPAHSDGFGGADDSLEGSTLYLDDVAGFAHQLDLRTGVDAVGKSFDASPFERQPLTVHTLGFSLDNQMLADAAKAGGGVYTTTGDPAALRDRLKQLFDAVSASVASASAPAANGPNAHAGTILYQSRYRLSDQSGDLWALPLNDTAQPVWQAASRLAARVSANTDSRLLVTRNSTGLTPLQWDQLDTSQQQDLRNDTTRLGWLRGQTGAQGSTLRDRPHPLGSLLRSTPVYVGAPGMRYTDAGYAEFAQGLASRPARVFVGDSDGMLHAFSADSGEEDFAYLPKALSSQWGNLSDPDHPAGALLDGPLSVGDVVTSSGAWRTWLVGTYGAGARGLFGLDITNPSLASESTLAASLASWEQVDDDMGYMPGAPLLVRTAAGWVVLASNGYGSPSGKGMLLVLQPDTGAVLARLATGQGTPAVPNELGAPAAVDTNGDGLADRAYAGDGKGQVWTFDLSARNLGQWAVALSAQGKPAPLTVLTDPAGNPQPISNAPVVGREPLSGKLQLFIATGRYLINSDATDTQTQSVYGLFDSSTAINLSRTDGSLATRTISDVGTGLRRAVGSDMGSALGWVLDLPAGERSPAGLQLRSDHLIWTSLTPTADACSFGGSSWLYELYAWTGLPPQAPMLDTNDDGIVSDLDRWQTADGQSGTPAGVSLGDRSASRPLILRGAPLDQKWISRGDARLERRMERAASPQAALGWRERTPP